MESTATKGKQRNYFAILSLIIGIVNFPMLLDSTAYILLRGAVGILALVLGIFGVMKFKKLGTGRGLAIAGIIVASLSAITILLPALEAARKSANHAAAKRLVGTPAPAFTLKTTSGASITAPSLAGDAFVLDFGTSPAAFQALNSLRNKFKDVGLQVFSVEPQSLVVTVSSFAHAKGFDVPILADSENGDAAAQAYHAAFPIAILVDKKGVVAGVYFGDNYLVDLETAVKSVCGTR